MTSAFNLKKLGKDEQIEPQVSRKKYIKIRVEISVTEERKRWKPEADSCEKINKIDASSQTDQDKGKNT